MANGSCHVMRPARRAIPWPPRLGEPARGPVTTAPAIGPARFLGAIALKLLSRILPVALAALAPAAPASADEPGSYAAAAHAVLERHCARCHQEGQLKEGLTRAKGGIGGILDLDQIVADPKLVSMDDPMSSKLVEVIGPYAYPSMPDDCALSADPEGCFPTDAEIKILTDWLSNIEEEERMTVTIAEEHELAAADLRSVPTNRQGDIRYVSFRVQNNDARLSDDELEAHRRGTIKMLNALSTAPLLFKDDAMGEREVILRVRLADLGWDATDWDILERIYPYGIDDPTDPDLLHLQRSTGARVPVMRSDWLAAYATVPPFYYALLDLPLSFEELQADLGIDANANLREGRAVRAGFQDSGVSDHNRLIERHDTASGFFWTSYDFAGSSGLQNLHEYPLGPKGAFESDRLAFAHDGGETIYTLPNGFHGYYLNTQDGERLDVGPTAIVRDTDYADGTGEVVNGISCISCHAKGMNFRDDTVAETVAASMSISAEDAQIVSELYPGAEAVNAILTRDMEDFLAVLDDAGVGRNTTVGGLEPVRGLFVYYHDKYVDLARAAAELGLTEEEMRMRAPELGPQLAGIYRRLDLSPLARDEWERAFPLFLARLTRYEPLGFDFATTQELPASVAGAGQTAAYDGDAPAVPAPTGGYPEPRPVHAGGATGYVPPITGHKPEGRLIVYTDRASYRVGEQGVITVEPRQDCRLTLFNIDPHGRACQMYPHPSLPDEVLKAGSTFTYPPAGGSMTFGVPGTETFVAMCNAGAAALDAERAAGNFGCIEGGGGYESAAGRAITDYVEEVSITLPGVGAHGGVGAAAYDPDDPSTYEGLLRETIRVEVE